MRERRHTLPLPLGKVRVTRKRDDVVRREHDVDPALERSLGNDVDRRGFQLHDEDLGIHLFQVGSERLAIGEVSGDPDDIDAVGGLEVASEPLVGSRRRRAEVRDGPPANVDEGARPQRSRDDVDVRAHDSADRVADVLPAGRGVGHRHDDEVRDA